MSDENPNPSGLPPKCTAEDATLAMHDHLVDKGIDARLRNGFLIDMPAIARILEDRTVVRYPVRVCFDASPLEKGEFAFPMPLGEHPSCGFKLCVHPFFEDKPEALPLLIAYHIPTINYGDIAGPAEAELFGAALMGMERDEYYEAVCKLADSIPAG